MYWEGFNIRWGFNKRGKGLHACNPPPRPQKIHQISTWGAHQAALACPNHPNHFDSGWNPRSKIAQESLQESWILDPSPNQNDSKMIRASTGSKIPWEDLPGIWDLGTGPESKMIPKLIPMIQGRSPLQRSAKLNVSNSTEYGGCLGPGDTIYIHTYVQIIYGTCMYLYAKCMHIYVCTYINICIYMYIVVNEI